MGNFGFISGSFGLGSFRLVYGNQKGGKFRRGAEESSMKNWVDQMTMDGDWVSF